MKKLMLLGVASLFMLSVQPSYAQSQSTEGDLAALVNVMVKQQTSQFTQQLRSTFKTIVTAQLEQNKAEFQALVQNSNAEHDEVVVKQAEKAADELAP
ncbi:MAG: hypothetical protein LAT77_09865 [Aliidiomarina sp.]|uniref:hypothetical protein n=1 Tax=Aliidiomarina sp. TaxID=1872439 RepID=UPI0025C4A8DC|nr:hypothetical protein [Aliidiomarina sp.]MCH8502199.1 hypothetical protein [Aliidiomarina sp.]